MDAQHRADLTYVMGHSAEERERLIQQAGLFGPITERFADRRSRLGNARPRRRLRVGDVSMLCARLVGAEGEIVGTDCDPPRWHERGSVWSERSCPMSASSKGIFASYHLASRSMPSLVEPC